MACCRRATRIRIALSHLAVAVAAGSLSGCQFHVSVSPFDSPAARNVNRDNSPQRIAQSSHIPAPQAHRLAETDDSQLPQGSGDRSDSRIAESIKQTGGWKPTQSSVRRAKATKLSKTVGAAATLQPVPKAPAAAAEKPSTPGDPVKEFESLWKDAQEQGIAPYPINLATALRLAGADNWNVKLAAERVREARTRLDAAQALWLPSLVAGLGYTKHDGKLQETSGNVIEVSRNALFVGGGARVGNAPLAGGGGGPARFFVDLSLADAIFKPLVERQLVDAEQARESATFNDTLLAASLAYFELVRAQGRLHNARNKDLKNAEDLLKQTRSFVAAGKGSQADVARVQTEVTNRKQQVVEAALAVKVASAELVRLLQLDPETGLVALEDRPDKPVPVELVSEQRPLAELISQGLNYRPELFEHQSRTEAARRAFQAERFRPWIPNLFVGASAGGLGGGVNDSFPQMDGRSDVDIIAAWELKNLGLGTRAARERRSSQYRQSLFAWHRGRDRVATEVTQAYHQVHAQRERIGLAESNLVDALRSLELNKTRITGLQGLPLEALQAVQAVANANDAYVKAVIEYNQAQVRLLRAIGNPIEQ